jgi:hypothetical protein
MTRLWRRLRHFKENDDGQVVILVIGAMVLVLAVAAVVIDGAHAFVVKRSMQNAVDAASLAAASSLPTDGSACSAACMTSVQSTADTYLGYNGFSGVVLHACASASDTDCFQTPYKGSNSYVQVRFHRAVATFFGGAIGVPSLSISASAAATAAPVTSTTVINGTTITGTTVAGTTVFTTSTSTTTTGQVNAALFADNTSCADGTGIVIGNTGNSDSINGYAISNGGVSVSGNHNTFVTNVSFGGPNHDATHCLVTTSGGASVANQTLHLDTQNWPVTYTRSAICAGHDSNMPVTVTSDGIYCSTVSIDVPKSAPVALHVTLVAPLITVSNQWNNSTMSPATGQTLTLWQTDPNNFSFVPNNSCLSGTVWIQYGDMTYTGNSACVGFYEAQDISITGNSVVLTGGGPPVGGTTTTMTTTTPIATIPGTTDPGTTTPPSTQTHTTGTTVGLGE